MTIPLLSTALKGYGNLTHSAKSNHADVPNTTHAHTYALALLHTRVAPRSITSLRVPRGDAIEHIQQATEGDVTPAAARLGHYAGALLATGERGVDVFQQD
jgi:hypothetical protein